MPTPVLLHSASLLAVGVPHAFTTRRGGLSRGCFDSLNFGNPSELPPTIERDSKSTIAANFELLANAIGANDRRVVQVHQVHGNDVHIVSRNSPHDGNIVWGDVKADAIVTDDPHCLVAIRTADCTPILLSSHDGRIVASVHAGWRGVISGVTPRAIACMRELGAQRIVAAIGPCIGRDSFEVGPEVVDIFKSTFGSRAPLTPCDGGKGLIDLKECLRLQMQTLIERVDILPHCTVRDRDMFFSHRRDCGVTGRMVGIIGCVANEM